MKVELSEQDLNNLVALCDFGLKADGLKAVNVLVPLAQKLSQALPKKDIGGEGGGYKPKAKVGGEEPEVVEPEVVDKK